VSFFIKRLKLGAAALLTLLAVSTSEAGFSTVVIDAGHGGIDRGGVPDQRISEKNLTLDVARRLRSSLQEAGLRTVMTRNADVFIPLSQRVGIANAQRSAVFVSIHFNSAPRPGAFGIETYYFAKKSAPLAQRVHSTVVKRTRSLDRRVRRRGYYVLRHNKIPAILVECGFLTNPFEGRENLSPEYRDKLASAIASAVIASSRR
jgi:N-acetylmuramoyl-L-alanine amidase